MTNCTRTSSKLERSSGYARDHSRLDNNTHEVDFLAKGMIHKPLNAGVGAPKVIATRACKQVMLISFSMKFTGEMGSASQSEWKSVVNICEIAP